MINDNEQPQEEDYDPYGLDNPLSPIYEYMVLFAEIMEIEQELEDIDNRLINLQVEKLIADVKNNLWRYEV
jgi:hypothetical protein